MAIATNTTRRGVLKAVVPSAAIAVLPLTVSAAGLRLETPVAKLWAEWKVAEKSASNLTEDASDEDGARLDRIVNDIGNRMISLPSMNATDLIYKVMAHTWCGEHDISDCPMGEELWAELQALVGHKAGRTVPL